MREQFEQRDADGLGRLGDLTVPRAGVTVETPALMPVVNPNILTVEPSRLGDEFGAEILITNSYIIRRDEDLRERARAEGLHEMLGFDGAIVTDSGSFQLAEYGEIDVTTEEIVRFQHEIGSDVGTPVDVPTPPDVDRERAERELAETETALADAGAIDVGDMLLNAPVQGSTFPDLRERAARHAYDTDLDVFPIGAVVPLMNAYRYADVVDVVLASKAGLGVDAPVHLFGAGHPSMFALAVAAGCDLFDSAAYALYARDGRYLTVRGTRHVDELSHLPCSCPVCVRHDAAGLGDLPAAERERRLAEHNLHVSFEEMRRVKGAIREGSLFELVEARARGHPALLDGYRRLLDFADRLEAGDAASKSTFFHLSAESARRPEVRRHHDRVRRLDVRRVGGDDGASEGEGDDGASEDDDAADRDDWRLLLTEGGFPTDGYDAVWRLVPPFGPFPRALSGTYPLTAQVPERQDDAAYLAAARGVASLVEATPDVAVTVAHADWPDRALATLPDSVTARRVQGTAEDDGDESGGDDGPDGESGGDDVPNDGDDDGE